MNAMLEGLHLLLTWQVMGLMMVGVLVGLYLGAVPGLGGMVGFSLLLPFTFNMSQTAAFALLLGMYAVTTTSDTLAAILIGVPGTGSAAATLIDGFPLSKQGQAMRALGAAYTSSVAGGLLGALALGASVPIIKPLILAFGPPEFFMLAVLGLCFVGTLSGGSASKGILGALIGLILSTIGYSTQGGIARYAFGTNYMLDGLKIVPVVLGLFAIPEIVELAVKGLPIGAKIGDQKSRIIDGVRDTFRNWSLVLRSSIIGIYIGLLPGVGGSIADWVAYGHAVQTAKDKSQFGKGDIRGIIAPESAVNAVKGSDLVPTIAFGIPGSAPMSILLGAFLVHGLRPGPDMLTTNLPFTFSLMWTLVIAHVAGALLMMVGSRQLAKVTLVRGHLLVPGIVLFSFMGAWMQSNQLGDWISLIGFGIFGLLMKKAGWPRPPIILGFVLGPIMEVNLDLSHQAFGWGWVQRPWVLVMLAILTFSAMSFGRKFLPGYRAKLSTAAIEEQAHAAAPAPGLSLGISAMLGLCFGVAVWIASGWTLDASFFPLATGIPGTLVAFSLLGLSLLRLSRLRPDREPIATSQEWIKTALLLASLAGIIVVSLLFGQIAALVLFVALYLALWARESWRMVIAQTVVGWGILFLLFDHLLHPIWLTALFPIFE